MKQTKYSEFFYRYRLLWAALLALFGTWGCVASLKTEDQTLLGNSVWSVVLFGLFVFVIYHALQQCSKRKLAVSLPFAFGLGATLLGGRAMYLYDHLPLDQIGDFLWFFAAICGVTIVLAAFFVLLFSYLPSVHTRVYALRIQNTKKMWLQPNWRFFLVAWAVILLCWLPTYLAAFPGIYNYDAPYQLSQIFYNGKLNAHHPILHTLYLYSTFAIGKALFGTYAAGMAIYSLSQTLMLSAAFAYACYWVARIKAPMAMAVFAVLYFALLPIHAIFAVSATKDVLFAAIVLLVVLFLFDMVQNREYFYHNKFCMIRFVAAICLMMFLRNNGFYMLLLLIPFFIWCSRKHRAKAVLLCAICIAVNFLYTGPLYHIIGVEKGDFREALSVPIQQMARAVRDNSEQLTLEERNAVSELIDRDNVAEAYNQRTADTTKNYFNTDRFKHNLLHYAGIYLSIGKKAPATYLNAALSVSIGSWYSEMNYPDRRTSHPYIAWSNGTEKTFGISLKSNLILERNRLFPALDTVAEQARQVYPVVTVPLLRIPENKYIMIYRHSLFPALDRAYSTYSTYTEEVGHQMFPVISMLFSPGFGCWILVIYGALCIYFKRWRYGLPLVLLIALWVTVLLSPVALLRYSYPLMVCCPILAATAFLLPNLDYKNVGAKKGKESS